MKLTVLYLLGRNNCLFEYSGRGATGVKPVEGPAPYRCALGQTTPSLFSRERERGGGEAERERERRGGGDPDSKNSSAS